MIEIDAEKLKRAERIREAIKASPLNAPAIGKKLGCTTQAVYLWRNTGSISPDMMTGLAELLGRDFKELWDGPLKYVAYDKKAKFPAYQIREVGEDFGAEPTDELVEYLDVRHTMGDGGDMEIEFVETKRKLAYQKYWLDREGLVAVNCRVVPVSGDSMLPYLADGDTVLIDITDNEQIIDGKVYAIWHNGPKLKRLSVRFDGSLVISSDNPHFPEEIVPAEQSSMIRVIGRARHRSGSGGL